MTTVVDLNDIQRVASIGTTGASTNWSSGSYAYDGTGNIKAIGSLAFVYDKVSRLTSGDAATGKTRTASFDAFGNVTQTATSDWGTQSFSYSASTNRLGNPVTYDAGGHLTYWGGYTYGYNELGQLFTVTGTGVNHTLLYDAFGERVADRDTLRGSTTLALRGLDGKLLRTYVEGGTSGTGAATWQEDWVWANGTLLATVSADPDAGTRYYTVDHLGTPRLVTDACATSVAQHNYYAFGLEVQPVTQDGERIRFTGQETDQQGTTGQTDDLVNMHARLFNPSIARFLSADLLRGDPHRPQSFNLFAYVKGRPSTYRDPFGFNEMDDAKKNGWFHEDISVGGSVWSWSAWSWTVPDLGGWLNFVFGDHGGGSAPSTTDSAGIKQTICGILPSGRTIGVSASYGGVGPTIYGAELVINYNSGQVSAFRFGGAGGGWNSGLQLTAYTGFIQGRLDDSNSYYSGGFTGANIGFNLGEVGGGFFLASSSGGLAALAGGRAGNSVVPDLAVRVIGASVSWTPYASFTWGMTATNYTDPTQLGSTWGINAVDQALYFARQVLCQ